MNGIHTSEPGHRGYFAGRDIAALVNDDRLRRILTMLDEEGIPEPIASGPSSATMKTILIVDVDGEEEQSGEFRAESDNGMFGGSSNWRGPGWMPMNVPLIRALLQFSSHADGDTPTESAWNGSGI